MDFLLSPPELSVISLCLLLAGVLWLKLPIAVLLAGLGFGGIWLMNGFEAARTMISNELWGTFSGYGMTVIPLFILMGQVCFYSGLNERLYKTLNILVGHVPGGLAVATILACGGFSAICGSNTATAATMSGVALPEMRRYGYDDAFSAGTIAVGATLGVIIPPSVVLIVIGIQTGLSTSTLFLASILPGIMLLLAFVLCAQAAVLRHPEWAPRHQKSPLGERLRALPGLSEVFLLWGGVLGGMSTGLVTPTEAGGLGSLIALLLGGVATPPFFPRFCACRIGYAAPYGNDPPSGCRRHDLRKIFNGDQAPFSAFAHCCRNECFRYAGFAVHTAHLFYRGNGNGRSGAPAHYRSGFLSPGVQPWI